MVTIVEIFYCAHQFRCAIENCGYSNISDNQVGMQFNCLEGLQNLKNVYLKTKTGTLSRNTNRINDVD